MNTIQKQQIVVAIETAITTLGSASKVATKCGLNDAYISMMRNGKWGAPLKDEHWQQVASALDVTLTGWQTVDTNNSRIVGQTLADAKANALFMAVSHNAGSGKTQSCKNFAAANAHRAVFYFQVEHGETNKVDFLNRLAASLGIDTRGRGYLSANRLADLVIDFFIRRLDQRPLLIVDEADKLTDKAKRWFIALYNAVEGRMGCVILGTENLEKQIRTGVVHSRNGYDEIDSRFGRKFIRLVGITQKEAADICRANGIDDTAMHRALFEECEPVTTTWAGRSFKVLKDLRPLVRKIQRELLQQTEQPVEAVTS